MENERKINQCKPVTDSVTSETQVKDIVPSGLLEDIRTIQAIHGRLFEYKKKRDNDDSTWGAFSEAADDAMDYLMCATYEMSAIAGKELDYQILNY